MKKFLSLILALLIMLTPTIVFADIKNETPFEANTKNSELFRIPAILTLNDGSVMAAADIRYNHGGDSPNNLDTLVAVSANGYNEWQYNKINYFDDYADDVTKADSASFIDSALGQSKKTGRVFIVTDAYPAAGGVNNSAQGSGYVHINGNDYLALAENGSEDYCYYVGEFNNKYAKVLQIKDSSETAYMVDSEYNLYFNGEPVLMKQIGSDKNVQQNIFYRDADLKLLCTSYLWLRYSDDNGKTWSDPVMLNAQVKRENEGFLGVAPGRMLVTEYNGTERIMFVVYDHNEHGDENAAVIYSDDNGETWSRGESVKHSFAAGKTSESQIVELNDGVLRMYCRNKSDFVASCDSTDGGVTWTRARCDEELSGRGNCMFSFVNTNKTIDGKKVIMGSYPSNPEGRTNGVVRVGTIEADNSINWIETYHVNQDTFAYSCLTELSDGNIGLLYEDRKGTHISYKVLTVDENGKISDISGDDIVFEPEVSEEGAKAFFKDLKIKLQKLFHLF